MPEQKTNFMASLDKWTEETIIFPLFEVARAFGKAKGDEHLEEDSEKAIWHTHEAIKRSVREKVLESYRNGQAAKPQKGRTWKK